MHKELNEAQRCTNKLCEEIESKNQKICNKLIEEYKKSLGKIITLQDKCKHLKKKLEIEKLEHKMLEKELEIVKNMKKRNKSEARRN